MLKYNAHVNVELYSSAKSVQYIYKYVTKGSDAANIAIQRERGDGPTVRDEIGEFQDTRWLGTGEALWRLFGFPTHHHHPAVYRLPVHLEHQQRMTFNPARDTVADIQESERLRKTKLTEYFELNRLAKEALENGRQNPFPKSPLEVAYIDLPKYFTWKAKPQKWTTRKKGDTIRRIYSISPAAR